MKRLYLEFFFGVSGLFLLCVLAFAFAMRTLAPDYEGEVEIGYVSGVVSILDDVEAQRGQPVADNLLAGFAKRNGLTVTPVPWDDPALSVEMANKVRRLGTAYQSDNHYWVTFGDRARVYYLAPDESASIWQHAETKVAVMWLSFLFTFALYSALMIRLLARRFNQLERATLAFAEGDFHARASENPKDRLGRLNLRFNQMADKIGALIASHKQLSNAVAHELRTPIFRVQCQLDLLESSELSAQQQSYVAGINEDMDELEALIEELLYYAKMERSSLAAGIMLSLKSVDVSALLQRVVLQAQKTTPVPVSLHCPSPCSWVLDAHHIERAVSNLIRNASRYAQNAITVTVIPQPDALVIQVDDDGCGIPEIERVKVLQPFYRVDSARDRQSGGHGLGLSIVSQIVSLHHGQLAITDSDSGGARVTITLPQ
ncbi:ATP-binding protein [Photobacterium aphoticum]|uniref:ATP-binding protein n=1 Tax=Photobacterium aphoticum TaxID=754436 RepID=UPI00069D91F2|nr:ATP-binding protein [Photobacterium aphoticum]PSU57109.1 HAMP domain-containing protein [Photobacterium aphoticum]GHA52952.1 sensor histidine kinase [Photobacterium aphoticum]